MPEYLTPGVYVEEFDRGPKPIEGVGTAMPVFIGFSEKAQSSEIVDGESVITDLLGQGHAGHELDRNTWSALAASSRASTCRMPSTATS